MPARRIREELRNGKTLDGALKLGFSESFWAIFDGNITTLIVAVMLMGVFGPSNILSIIFGESTTGAIFSFGFTLLVGIIGSHRRIGFGWAFLISLIFTPLVGLIVALLTDPLPGGGQRWGCVGTVVAILGLLFFAAFLLLALTGGAMLLAL